MDNNGSKVWNGLVGQLVRGEADLCGAGLAVTAERSQAVDFSVGVAEEIVSIFIAHRFAASTSNEINFVVYLQVFSATLWLAVLLLTLLYACAHTATHILGKTKLSKILKEYASGVCYYWLAIIQKDNRTLEEERSFGDKVLILTSHLAFVLFACYGCDLTAKMTVGTKPLSFTSYQDILDYNYDFYAEDSTVYSSLLLDAEPGTAKYQVARNRMKTKPWETFLLETLEDPSNAIFFGGQYGYMNGSVLRFEPDFEGSFPVRLAFAFGKGSDLRGIFDHHLAKMAQGGLIEKLAILIKLVQIPIYLNFVSVFYRPTGGSRETARPTGVTPSTRRRQYLWGTKTSSSLSLF